MTQLIPDLFLDKQRNILDFVFSYFNIPSHKFSLLTPHLFYSGSVLFTQILLVQTQTSVMYCINGTELRHLDYIFHCDLVHRMIDLEKRIKPNEPAWNCDWKYWNQRKKKKRCDAFLECWIQHPFKTAAAAGRRWKQNLFRSIHKLHALEIVDPKDIWDHI